ncbi:MAG TPA: PH domain-containing protein [Bryobacteraceae bacterium]|nr:PH domain-containing protein [Bryobacteraceae bacterium]
MNDFTIRPTLKFIQAGTIAAALVFLALEILYLTQWRDQVGAWVMALPPLIFLWPLTRWLRWRSVRIVVMSDRLRYEKGLVSKDVRTLELNKLQCVNVHQGMMQRVFGVGDIAFETAGQGTWTPMRHVDHPQRIADELMNRGLGSAAIQPPPSA